MIARRRPSRLLVALFLSSTVWTFPGPMSSGQAEAPKADADPIKDRLEKAREADRRRLDSIKRDVRASLDLKIANARKQGNKALVDQLEAEKDKFVEDVNEIPPSLGKRWLEFCKRVKNAHLDLDSAYSRAIREYTRAGKDAAANAIKAEQEAFRKKNAATVPYRPEPPVEPPPDAAAIRALFFDPKILINSGWDFTIINQTIQKGGFKIVDCQIRHIDNDVPAGFAEFAPDGQLHLIFQNHRKIAAGEALVGKVANGQGRGVLISNLGGGKFELSRRW